VPHLRLDLWPTWLEIGCEHTRRANDTAATVSPSLADPDKATLLSRELQEAMVAMCAFAFAFDGFYDVVKSELGEHPNAAQWRQEGRRPTPRHKQVAETLRYHLKLGPQFTGQLKQFLKELFKFRGRAVHPSSSYLPATMREDIDSGVHPHLITFSGKHAVQCRAIALVLLNRLVERAAEVVDPSADKGWIESGRREWTGYRIPIESLATTSSPIRLTSPSMVATTRRKTKPRTRRCRAEAVAIVRCTATRQPRSRRLAADDAVPVTSGAVAEVRALVAPLLGRIRLRCERSGCRMSPLTCRT
jgi:hypothetical protein